MARYRYRTPVLIGPWRETPDQALQDAARADQARIDRSKGMHFQWIVPGQIEEDLAGR